MQEALVQAARFGISSEAPDTMAGLFQVWLDVRLEEVDPYLAATTDLLATVFLVACGHLSDAFELSRAAVTALAAAAAAPPADADASAATDTYKVLLVYAAELCIAVLAALWHASPEETEESNSAAGELVAQAWALLKTVAEGLQGTHVCSEGPAAEAAQAWGRCAWVRLAEHLFASLRPSATADSGEGSLGHETAVFQAASGALEASTAHVVGHGTCAVLAARILSAAADTASPAAVFGTAQVARVMDAITQSDTGARELLLGLTAHALPTVLPAVLQHRPQGKGESQTRQAPAQPA